MVIFMINPKRIAMACFILLNLAIFVPNIYRSQVKITKLQKEICALKEAQANIKDKIESYDKEIESLKDINNREKMVRNKLQMVKHGEIIYRVTK